MVILKQKEKIAPSFCSKLDVLKNVMIQLSKCCMRLDNYLNYETVCYNLTALSTCNLDNFSKYFQEGSMPATFSYGSILHAVGQVLDQIGVKSIAIHEEDDGLFVEGFDSDGQLQVQMRYDIASLYELLNRQEEQATEDSSIQITGILHRFLADHDRELVGATF